MLVDVFHQERWDYVYTMDRRGKPLPGHRLSVYFDDNRLARVQGDFRPEASPEALEPRTETVVSVPDYTGDEKGLFGRALRSVGIGGD
jgi:outer membrane protein assembly factor BamE